MSILISGMEMPTSCLQGGCPIEGAFCTLWTEEHWKSPDEPYRKRHPNCPLIELFSHGDLIDRSHLCDDSIGGDYGSGIRVYYAYEVEHAPVIIPASKEG